ILPKDAQNLIVAGSLISIMLNPLAFFVVDLLRPRLETRAAQRQGEPAQRVEPGETIDAVKGAVVPESAPSDDIEPSRQTDHIVLVGFGRVGSVIGQALTATGSPLVVVEDAEHSIEAARAGGMEVVRGNAASTAVLKLANLAGAKVLLVAISNGFEAGSVVEAGRKLNPGIRILARAHSEEEAAHLRHFGANEVIMGEREIGLGMLAWLRGERGEADAPSPVPAEPKLAPVDNILEKMAATPAAIAVPVVAAVEAIESVVQPAAMVEAAELAAEPGIELPPDPNRVDDPEGVEAERDAVPAEEPATEAVMEAEAAEAESVIVLPPPAPAPDEAVEIAAEDAVAEADEISEGGPVTPPAAPEVDKPTDSDVPAVVPEPKI
ncbi:MAG TPA: NAD-binding protein, partial [Devosia sp.]|nr:NAD-binding protein [Devosia sp.]